jgi:hypothetical protein
MEYFPIDEVRAQLEAQNGDWKVVHESPNLEVGVLVRVAPTPDPPCDMQPTRSTSSWPAKRPSRRMERAAGSSREMPRSCGRKEHHFVDYELISILVLFARGG